MLPSMTEPRDKIQLKVYLPEDLRRRLRVHAAETGDSVSAIVDRAVRNLLDEEEKKDEHHP